MKLRRTFICFIILAELVAVALGILMINEALSEGAEYIVAVSDWCNIREKPRKDSADTGNLYAGDTVTGTSYQAGWVQVEASVEAGTGWVREDLLTLADYPVGTYTNSTGGRVNIRKTPYADKDNHARWLDSMHSVDVIRWVSVDGTTWAVTKKGYIKSDCLSLEEGE